ncbi:MAG TPA: hypothetical protein VNV66_20930 [Pilimelia sp.]|nr:hypothetical protein [Pilimelia sp.]
MHPQPSPDRLVQQPPYGRRSLPVQLVRIPKQQQGFFHGILKILPLQLALPHDPLGSFLLPTDPPLLAAELLHAHGVGVVRLLGPGSLPLKIHQPPALPVGLLAWTSTPAWSPSVAS